MTHEHVVVLRVLVDGDGGAPAWWEAMQLPHPDRWDEELPETVHATVVLEEEVKR